MATLNDIVKAADTLPTMERRRLLLYLQNANLRDWAAQPLAQHRLYDLLAVAEKAMDIHGDILCRSRRHEYVWARFCVAYQLRLEGYSTADVARSMGISRATVQYGETIVEAVAARPESSPADASLLRAFRLAVEEPSL
jgi:hypothetical protein